jgi:hypothetical protein
MRRNASVVAVVGVLLAIVGAVVWPDFFFRGYLLGYMFCLGLSLGSMALVMVGHLSGGNWWMIGRRPMEAAIKTLPLLLIGFLPIALGMKKLYIWSHADLVAQDKVMQIKAWYLNPTGFVVRAVIYLLIWNIFAWLLTSGSAKQDVDASPAIWQRLKAISGPGILIYGLTITLASVDWVMSLDPHWYSTIFGMIFMISHLLSSMSFVVLIVVALSDWAPMSEVLKKDRLHDMGKWMLAFTMVWAYFNFSQWLIIWMANLPEEISWFLDRLKGGWQTVAVSLVLFQFALPFALLLSRDLKRSARKLVPVAVLVLFMRLVDLYWLIAPNPFPGTQQHHISLNPNFVFVPLGIIGVWLTFFFWNLAQRPLLVVNEPMLPRLWKESHGH